MIGNRDQRSIWISIDNGIEKNFTFKNQIVF